MLEERKKRVIDLYYKEEKNTREIASIERMSIRDISAILKEEEARKQRYEKEEELYMKDQLENVLAAKAYKLFDVGKSPVQVADGLKLREPIVSKLYKEYLKLKGLSQVVLLWETIGDDVWPYLELYEMASREGMSNKEVVNAVKNSLNELPMAEQRCRKFNEEADTFKEQKKNLLKDIDFLNGNKLRLIEVIFDHTEEIKDLAEDKRNLAEYRDRKKEEIDQLIKDEQKTEETIFKHQKMISALIIAAVQTYMGPLADDFSSKLKPSSIPLQLHKTIQDIHFEGIEVQEMNRGDIAE